MARLPRLSGTDFSVWPLTNHRLKSMPLKNFHYGSGVESRKTANDASQCSPA